MTNLVVSLDSGKFLKEKEVALKAVIWYP